MSTDREHPADLSATSAPPDATPPDLLLAAALRVADREAVDWSGMRQTLPEETRAVAGLEVMATIAAAHGNTAPDGDPEGAPADASGFAWGRLRAHRLLGQGAYGEVWSAWDRGLDREVALKLRLAASGGTGRRWLEEARRLAQVRHPNVVVVHGADEHDGRVGLWMDRIHGRTLEDLLAFVGPCSAREAAAIGMDLCAALAAVHAVGLVHGDLKLQNVMREGAPGHAGGAGRIVLMDFGSAHSTTAGPGESAGTPLYTAPEILRGGRATPAADLYALGVLLYRLVAGRYPVDALTVSELTAKLERGEVTPLRAVRPDLPNAFVGVVERALATDPAQRFPNAAAMERALASAAGFGIDHAPAFPWARVRRALAPAAAVLAAVAVVVAFATAPRWRPVLFPKKAAPDRLSTLQVADWVGDLPDGMSGFAVAGIGDWNADGVPDIAVGTFKFDDERGKVEVRRGGATWSERPDWVLQGESLDDSFGRTIAGVGDLDGDGHADFAVSSLQNDRGGQDAGAVYVFRGGPNPDGVPDLVLVGRRPGQAFGDKLAPAGDVNGDGGADLLVSAPWDDQAGRRAGRAYLYFGGKVLDAEPDAEFALGTEAAQFGEGRGIGDWNGDGFDDFVLSARNAPGDAPRAGTALVYFGGKTIDTNPDVVLRGEGENQFFGALGPCGDVNGDGHADLIVGAFMAVGKKEPESGALYVYFGGPQGDARADVVLRGENEKDFFAMTSDASTDFDGDGIADVLVTANGKDAATDSAGTIYLFHGGKDFDDVPDLVLRGRGVRTGFGASLSVAGDTRGDGVPDLIVGCPGDARGGPHAGSARLFDFARFHVVRPRAGRDAWAAGGKGTLEWLGATRADVALSTDGGRSWKTVKSRAGGGVTNVLALDVPASATGSVRLRVAPSDRAIKTGTVDVEVPLFAGRPSGAD